MLVTIPWPTCRESTKIYEGSPFLAKLPLCKLFRIWQRYQVDDVTNSYHCDETLISVGIESCRYFYYGFAIVTQ